MAAPRGPLAFALVARNAAAAARSPVRFASAFLEPVLYLASIGLGVGALVGQVEGPGGVLTDYDQFVAPALLATSAMFGAVFDTTISFFVKYKYLHTYDAVLATPLTPMDVATGETLWGQLNGALHSTFFLLAMGVLGLWASPWAVLAVPGALLVGYAFGGAGLLAATYLRSWLDFDLLLVVIMPMFLFAGVFFPLEQYPEAIRWLVRITPLYQGVALERAVVFGQLSPGLLVPVAYLVAMGTAGRWWAARRLARLLQP